MVNQVNQVDVESALIEHKLDCIKKLFLIFPSLWIFGGGVVFILEISETVTGSILFGFLVALIVVHTIQYQIYSNHTFTHGQKRMVTERLTQTFKENSTMYDPKSMVHQEITMNEFQHVSRVYPDA